MLSGTPAGHLNNPCVSDGPWVDVLPAQGDGTHRLWIGKWLHQVTDKRHRDHAQVVDIYEG